MPLPLDDYRCKLIGKILQACSQDEVKRYCAAAIKGLEGHKVNAFIIARFIDKAIGDLEQFSPMDKDAQQWSNIKVARIYLKRTKERSGSSVR